MRVIGITDRQWATGLHFEQAKKQKTEGAPEQLTIF